MLTLDRLKELLHYDPITGEFTRLVGRSGPRARVGDIAGHKQSDGYVRIYVDGKAYKAHRLAWFYMAGEWPKEIDHINGDKGWNAFHNLRPVTRSQNRMNVGVYRSSKSGIRGVNWCALNKKWKAQIQRDGVKKSIGYFATAEAAKAAYDNAAAEMHGAYRRRA